MCKPVPNYHCSAPLNLLLQPVEVHWVLKGGFEFRHAPQGKILLGGAFVCCSLLGLDCGGVLNLMMTNYLFQIEVQVSTCSEIKSYLHPTKVWIQSTLHWHTWNSKIHCHKVLILKNSLLRILVPPHYYPLCFNFIVLQCKKQL